LDRFPLSHRRAVLVWRPTLFPALAVGGTDFAAQGAELVAHSIKDAFAVVESAEFAGDFIGRAVHEKLGEKLRAIALAGQGDTFAVERDRGS
jgi:hypothetical protein